VAQTKISDEVRASLGQAVLDFGFMEHLIVGLIKFLSQNEPIASAIIPPGKTTTEYLEILKRLCAVRIDPEALQDWYDAIEDIRKLFDDRNTIFHSMIFETSEKILMIKGKKRKGATQSNLIEFDPAFVTKTLSRLEARRRQFMDFFDDFRESDDGAGREATQDLFPSLRIKG
jgi:hypothetical protein